jgi:hypothetical protein
MKPYFWNCSYCGELMAMEELEETAPSFLICKDAVACDQRVKDAGSTYYTALKAELEQLEARRPELILLIEAERIRLGLPDITAVRHQVELARIEAEI